MPVFWFALSFAESIDVARSVLVFAILHLLVYPSSNGYNSFMDRDVESIGGIKNPMQPTRQLFKVSVMMDVLAIALSALVSNVFAACVFIYIICSRLYSYRKIRLKQYPLLGYATVIANQGALTFFMVYSWLQRKSFGACFVAGHYCCYFFNWRILSAHTSLSA